MKFESRSWSWVERNKMSPFNVEPASLSSRQLSVLIRQLVKLRRQKERNGAYARLVSWCQDNGYHLSRNFIHVPAEGWFCQLGVTGADIVNASALCWYKTDAREKAALDLLQQLVSDNATPVSDNATPVSDNATPVSDNATPVSDNATPLTIAAFEKLSTSNDANLFDELEEPELIETPVNV